MADLLLNFIQANFVLSQVSLPFNTLITLNSSSKDINRDFFQIPFNKAYLITKLKVRYDSIEFPDFDIHLRTLKNKNQYSDDDQACEKLGINSTLWSIFGVVWPAGEIMARLMCTQDIKNIRILEIGCGIALSSLVLNERLADITATDYHPEAKKFLELNVKLNNEKEIEFHICDWKDKVSTLERYDLIIGSDILYEAEHYKDLSNFIADHCEDDGEVIIVSPNRGYQNKFNREMEKLSFSHEQVKPENTEYLKDHFNGYIHTYKKQTPLQS